ncbi:hypothetical protein [Salisaeta longa]|uniref:hypothetical protein n=1 Tax=Salisaeta longa TaxID=503170 RepID=UPI0003B6A203|nr:hypothetical protein [Salisaeta longa]
MPPAAATRSTFRSIHHPGADTPAVYYARRFGKALLVCVLPVFIGVTVQALLGARVWPLALWGSAGAVGVAAAWMPFIVRAQVAAVVVRGDQVAVRRVHDVLAGRVLQWTPILGARLAGDHVTLVTQTQTYTLRPSQWPSYSELTDAINHARGRTTQRSHR